MQILHSLDFGTTDANGNGSGRTAKGHTEDRWQGERDAQQNPQPAQGRDPASCADRRGDGEAGLWKIEEDIRARDPAVRLTARRDRSAAIVADIFKPIFNTLR